MDELQEKIKQLSRNRIEYFLKNPHGNKDQFLKHIKGQISTLVQACFAYLNCFNFYIKGDPHRSGTTGSNRLF